MIINPILIIIKLLKEKRFRDIILYHGILQMNGKVIFKLLFFLQIQKKLYNKDNMKGYSIVGAFKYIGFGFYYNDLLIYD